MRYELSTNEGFERFVTTTQHKLRGAIYKSGGRPADIEDIMQDTYLRVFLNRNKVDITRNPVAYVNTIGRNLVIDRSRSFRGKHEVVDSDTIDGLGLTALDRATDGNCVEDEVVSQCNGETIYDAVENLKPVQKEVLKLTMDGMSHSQIAEATGECLGTIKSRQLKAKRTMREIVKNI